MIINIMSAHITITRMSPTSAHHAGWYIAAESVAGQVSAACTVQTASCSPDLGVPVVVCRVKNGAGGAPHFTWQSPAQRSGSCGFARLGNLSWRQVCEVTILDASRRPLHNLFQHNELLLEAADLVQNDMLPSVRPATNRRLHSLATSHPPTGSPFVPNP